MLPADIFKEVIQDLPDQTSIAIATLKNGRISFDGLIKTDGVLLPSKNERAIFEIGSVTKIFAGYILAKWVLEGKVNLHDPISQYLPFNLHGNPPITWAQLALHTAGLPKMPHDIEQYPDYNPANPLMNYDSRRLEHYLSNLLQLDSRPGEVHQYSNLGFGILSYMTSYIERRSFADLVEEHIFKPLGMVNSSFNAKTTSAIKGIDAAGNTCPHWDGGIMNGCLGILSSAEDLIRFGAIYLDSSNDIVNFQLENTFDVLPGGFHSNLGWGQRTLPNGIPMLGINGGTAGTGASLLVNRRDHSAIAVLTNIVPEYYMEHIYPLNKQLLISLTL
jgi:CubicO group peptidase (beta-lactamase class C family)